MNYLDKKDKLLSYELKKWNEGLFFVAGIDEAGRGPLAGPVVAAAVIFDKETPVPFVNDSKQLSEKQRMEIRDSIMNTPKVKYAVIEVSPGEIDEINILRATHAGMMRAVEALSVAEFAYIDGLPVPGFPIPSEAIVKGDSKCASIAAASILAKTRRDEIMVQYASSYPEYGFEKHKGYGTAIHLEALKKYGPTPIHRKSFAPVRDILSPPPEQMAFDL